MFYDAKFTNKIALKDLTVTLVIVTVDLIKNQINIIIVLHQRFYNPNRVHKDFLVN